ncbi:MAG TPA: hypothetical protein VND93_33900 [Myxococcales bacterium]|nr:hypothetical protein [Myxococcales bacterium]
MEDAPLLKADGALVYSSPESFRRHYALYLAKGGALVRPEAPLRPLESLQIRLALPSSGELTLEAEVANIAGALCLLHFTDFGEDAASRLRREAEEAPPEPPPPPVAEANQTPEGPVPGPPSDELLREVAAMVAGIAPEEPLLDLPPPPPPPLTPMGAEARAPPAPPAGGRAFVVLESPRSPSPSPSPPPPSSQVPSFGTPVGAFMPAGGPTPSPFRPPTRPPVPIILTPEPSAAVHALGASAALLFKTERTFKNPATPQEFLALPLLRPPAVDQAPEPATPLVLHWLGVLKSPAVSLRIRLGRSREALLYVIWGTELRSSTPMDALVRWLGELSGQLEIQPVAESPKAPFSASLASMRFSVLRELLKRYSEADLGAAMSARMGMSPRLNAHGVGLLRALGLSEPQMRMSQRLLGGQHPLDVVLNNGIGVRSTWQVIYLQQLLGGLTWVDPPPRENVVVEELRLHSERVRTADHFEALGLHYTSPPRAVDRAFERMQREYGPGSRAAAQSARLAGEIFQRAQQAHAALKTAAGRKQYRKEKYSNVRMDYAAQIVASQSQLAEMRGELELAVDLMEAAVELHPSADLVANLSRVRTKKAGG